ncbi:MAG: hypothetical protein B1H08_03650 [Candidatus Omnitrophica bacterium 4484_171]|nr:MAG: hypothetical protein B1H08_03650 [Candidatus Omnitrophica bacterium 4484_171]
MRRLSKKILFIPEIAIIFFLVVFFSIKIIDVLYISTPYPQIKNKSIYLEGAINKRNGRFYNLISFDYRKFLVRFPGWHNHIFRGFINSRSFIVTSYSLDDFANILLRMHFPYWRKGGVRISFKIGSKWYLFEDLIELKDKDYSLDDIFFLGLGMENNVDSRGISEKEFLSEYFKYRAMSLKDNILRLLPGKVTVKLTLK